jgi:hypothetical protein
VLRLALVLATTAAALTLSVPAHATVNVCDGPVDVECMDPYYGDWCAVFVYVPNTPWEFCVPGAAAGR